MNASILRFLLIPGMAALAGCGGSGSSGTTILPPSPLSGVISIEAGSRVDQDTMDQLVLEGARPATGVQSLPASFVLAGYVSGADGTYPPDDSECQSFDYALDIQDDFSVSLAPGETLVLQSFGSCAGDPLLELQVESGPVLVSSVAEGAAHYTVPPGETREYRLSVRNTGGGPARYVLAKSSVLVAGGMAFDWPRHQFVEGEAIVSLTEESERSVAAAATSAAYKARQLGPGGWLMTMPRNAVGTATSTPPANETLEWIRDLRRTPGVKSASPNYLFSSQQSQTPVGEEDYPRQWHYDLINGPTSWQLEPGGGVGVNVAVLDSGLLQLESGGWHPDLDANVSGNRANFVEEGSDPVDPGSSVGGDVFHGTHVAGTIAAVVNGVGIGGVAFGSEIVPVRVLGEGGTGSSDDLIEAIYWLVDGAEDGKPFAEVVNMSLGGLPRIQPLEDAIVAGVKKNMLFVAAAGNSASSIASYPAASVNVLAVSAVDGAGQLASYSNFGGWIDLAAPGGDASRDGNLDGQADVVWSTSGEQTIDGVRPGYRGLQGTSMASPHVAGVLALMKARNPGLNQGAVRALLQQSELTDFSGARSDALGYGVLDAAKAVSAAANGFDGAVLSASPALVSLSNEGDQSVVVDLNVFGDGNVAGVRLLDSFPDWVDVEASLSSQPYSLQVTLLRDRLEADEPARGDINIAYDVDGISADPLTIPVIGQLVSDEQARNAGRHFVLLVATKPDDKGLYMAESQVTVDAENGVYGFRFETDDGEEPGQLSEVRPGDYYLVAGTDLDGDGIICQPGEACAEYPITGMREIITIEEGQSLSDIRMTTSFSRPTISAASPDILPRPGFQGYRLMLPAVDSAPADNRIRMTQ